MLFDDLPEAKKGSLSSSLESKSDTGTKQDEKEQVPNHDESQCNNGASKNKQEKKSKSLVESVGNAGTTMAFVPAALRKRKPLIRNSSKPRKSEIKSDNDPGDTTTVIMSSGIPTIETTAASFDSLLTNKHKGDPEKEGTQSLINKSKEESDFCPSQLQPTEEPQGQESDKEEEYKEPQHLTDLHASVRSTDMYHPMMPNDYLAYKQRKENEMLHANLERQTQKTLDMQRKLREQIEEERQKALASGDVNKIIESRLGTSMASAPSVGIGRGRGRGLNNLPAWLVKKQQEEQNLSS